MNAAPNEGCLPAKGAPALYDHAFMRVPGAVDIIDPIILPDHETAIGIIDVPGAGWRVATVSNGAVQQMSPARAMRLAQEFEGSEHAKALHAVSSALRLVARVA